jgi:cytochrome c oxidase subunit 3
MDAATATATGTAFVVPTAPSARHDRAKFGMWLFLASEIMFFGGFIAAYVILRMAADPEIIEASKAQLDWRLGALNTAVLILSSFTMALAVDAAARGMIPRMRLFVLATAVLACVFMGVKYVEYTAKFTHSGIVAEERDGKIYLAGVEPFVTDWRLRERIGWQITKVNGEEVHDPAHVEHVPPFAKVSLVNPEDFFGTEQEVPVGILPRTNVFFTAYFTLTGFHALHVLGGIVVLLGVFVLSFFGLYKPHYYPVEMTGLYWHFVDVVWIFLFPLLYLL